MARNDDNVFQLVPQQGLLPVEFDNPADRVFQFWKALMGHQRSQMGQKRATAIRRALAMGYTVDDLRLAIVGCRVSGFHQGENKSGETYDDIELICRDETKIDKFLKLGEQKVRDMLAKEQRAKEDAEHQPVPMPPEVRAKLDALFANALKRQQR